MADLPIPADINQIDPAWLSTAIRAPVRDFQIQQIGQGVGIMGEIYRVQLNLQEPSRGPASVVVKLPSTFEENRNQGVALGMFEAEVRFYNELAQRVAVGLPEVLLARVEPGTANFVIVMEDLSHLTMVDQSIGMSAQQALSAVTVLAHIHAAWWNQVQTDELDWIETLIGPRIAYVEQILPQILPVFLDSFAQYLPSGGAEAFKRIADRYSLITSKLADRSPWTLAHLDFRVDNLLFGPAGSSEVVVLDWQGIGRGPGAYDLAYVLSGSMDIAARRQHEHDLVQAYHQQLLQLGIREYSFDQLWDDYGLAQLMGGPATTMVIGGGMDLSNERGVQLVASMARRHITAAMDHGASQRLNEIFGEDG